MSVINNFTAAQPLRTEYRLVVIPPFITCAPGVGFNDVETRSSTRTIVVTVNAFTPYHRGSVIYDMRGLPILCLATVPARSRGVAFDPLRLLVGYRNKVRVIKTMFRPYQGEVDRLNVLQTDGRGKVVIY